MNRKVRLYLDSDFLGNNSVFRVKGRGLRSACLGENFHYFATRYPEKIINGEVFVDIVGSKPLDASYIRGFEISRNKTFYSKMERAILEKYAGQYKFGEVETKKKLVYQWYRTPETYGRLKDDIAFLSKPRSPMFLSMKSTFNDVLKYSIKDKFLGEERFSDVIDRLKVSLPGEVQAGIIKKGLPPIILEGVKGGKSGFYSSRGIMVGTGSLKLSPVILAAHELRHHIFVTYFPGRKFREFFTYFGQSFIKVPAHVMSVGYTDLQSSNELFVIMMDSYRRGMNDEQWVRALMRDLEGIPSARACSLTTGRLLYKSLTEKDLLKIIRVIRRVFGIW